MQNESGTGVTLAAIEEVERSTLQQQHVATLLQQAQAQWEAPGHPGWGFAGGRDEAARGFTQSPQVVYEVCSLDWHSAATVIHQSQSVILTMLVHAVPSKACLWKSFAVYTSLLYQAE